MGWLEYRATHFYKDGTINRKKECDAYFEDSLNRSHFKVVKSRMVGSTYYGAIMPLKRVAKDHCGVALKDDDGVYIYEEIPENEREVLGVVMLTGTRDGKWFSYKLIDETMGPNACDCPKSVLDALTSIDNEYAQDWRKRCRERLTKPNLSKLPIGTEIEFTWNSKTVILRKSAPRFQFKTPFWMNNANCTYFSKKHIPNDFKIISMP